MAERNTPIRVLIVDDEPEIRDAYRQILCDTEANLEMTGFHELRSRLFRKNPTEALRHAATRATSFDTVFCQQAAEAVEAVKEALARNEPFAVVFLDMRMPPGRDGVWAATQIRELDPAVEIVICTAYSDADPGEIGGYVPPEDKLSYLQKPFHPHEVRQMTIALGSKWRAERRIVRLAYFDTLTGLPNREQSRNRLSGALQAAKEKGGLLAVLYLDLDNFKRVNDTLGHAAGDQLLCVVADRLRSSLRYGGESSPGGGSNRPGDIARLGGDEFMVLLPNLRTTVDAGGVAERLILALRQPIQVGSNSLVVTPSVGIALYPQDGADAETLLRNADLAMYFAKRRAPGTFALFDVSMNTTALHRFTIEEQLRGGQPARVHSGRRGDRPDPPDRQVGAARCMSAGEGLDRRGVAGAAHGGERVRPPVRARRVSAGGLGDPRRDRARSGGARARNHRVGRHGRRGLGREGHQGAQGARDFARHR